ncbi:MAG: 30S ribosomal protein S17 [Rubrobacteraceae bacterium]
MAEEKTENQGLPEEQEPTEGPAGEPTEEEPLEEVLEAEVAEEPVASQATRVDLDEGRVQTDSTRGTRKERVGMVVSDAPEKTVTVSVETLVRHPLYKKRVRSSKKFLVHDEQNDARLGDTVRIIETRPISRRKHWRLANVISRAE